MQHTLRDIRDGAAVQSVAPCEPWRRPYATNIFARLDRSAVGTGHRWAVAVLRYFRAQACALHHRGIVILASLFASRAVDAKGVLLGGGLGLGVEAGGRGRIF
jgi:hypothetical protein